MPSGILTPSASRCVMTQIVMPGHANGESGVMFGGIMMQWIDVCAGVAAMRHAGGTVLTASIDRLDFMYGTYGIDEHGNLRDERDRILPVDGHNVLEAWVGTVDLSGDLLIHLADQNLYDDQHGIVGRGDLVYTSLSDSQKIIGFISVDNLFSHKPFDQLQQQILVLFARQLGTLYLSLIHI